MFSRDRRCCRQTGRSAYVTTYQRDIGMGQNSCCANTTGDDVGKSKKFKGKKMFHVHRNGGSFAESCSFRTQEDTGAVSQSPSVCAGHLPGYTGHVPKSRPHKFTPGDTVQARNHQKDFFLLPENYKNHVIGYTGHQSTAPKGT